MTILGAAVLDGQVIEAPHLASARRTLALLMIALSDNLCTNLVIRRIGIERLRNVFREQLGLIDTRLERKLMDYEARPWAGQLDLSAGLHPALPRAG